MSRRRKENIGKMRKVRYTGGLSEVWMGKYHFRQGEEKELPSEVAQKLLAKKDFEEVK